MMINEQKLNKHQSHRLFKFERGKTYAIGALQRNSLPEDAPSRFSNIPIPPIYITGAELQSRKIKTVYDFLNNNCPFKIGTTIYFFEVIYSEERQELRHFFTGTALAPTNLSDDADVPTVEKNNYTLVASANDGTSKQYVKSQADQISLLTKINADDRVAFDKERKEFIKKIDEQNQRIVSLNIAINTLEAEKRALEIRAEEQGKLMEQLINREPDPEPEQPQRLADKGVAVIDSVLGDGASQQLVAGLASGLGEGIGKLIDVGISFAQAKGLLPSPNSQVQQEQSVQMPTVQVIQPTPTVQYTEQEQLNNIFNN